ncbi:primary ciliary dyskinesia protein 1 [Cystoisospora suis]|uniref:Primary ciliary dyskinesia protein 1 n=1 Tax=Cystoisospora suis TaxID=483139 RepID=A0A2C6KQB2_9APIC|nr:primary ciliary dyskinesia protein 1 [Cystoisospora suis]
MPRHVILVDCCLFVTPCAAVFPLAGFSSGYVSTRTMRALWCKPAVVVAVGCLLANPARSSCAATNNALEAVGLLQSTGPVESDAPWNPPEPRLSTPEMLRAAPQDDLHGEHEESSWVRKQKPVKKLGMNFLKAAEAMPGGIDQSQSPSEAEMARGGAEALARRPPLDDAHSGNNTRMEVPSTVLAASNAAGTTTLVEVYFSPVDWKLHRSSLKVLCSPVQQKSARDSTETLAAANVDCYEIGLYAFPELRNIRIPRFLDFGRVLSGESAQKSFVIVNEHPVSFEFTINTLSSSPDFSVAPASGDVPASGSITISVFYKPAAVTTSFFSFEVRVADCGSKPFRVDAVGSCCAHMHEPLVNDKPSAPTSSSAERGRTHFQRVTVSAFSHTTQVGNSQRTAGPKYVVYNGVVVPDINGHAICSSVLTQQAGKLADDMAKKQATVAPCCGPRDQQPSGVGTPDFARGFDTGYSAGLATKKVHFEKRWKQVMKSRRGKHQKFVSVLGELPPTEMKAQRLLCLRRLDCESMLQQCSSQDRRRDQPEFPSDRVIVRARWLPKQIHGGGASVDESMNNSFLLRRECRTRFTRMVSYVIKRNRSLRRLASLQRVLAHHRSIPVTPTDVPDAVLAGESHPDRNHSEGSQTRRSPVTLTLSLPRCTTAQRLFRLAATQDCVPASFLVREYTQIGELFKCVEEYSNFTPISQPCFEVMALPQFSVPSSAWHLEQNDRNLLGALLGPASLGAPGRLAGRDESHRRPLLTPHFDPPVIHKAGFIAPTAVEFRPLVPLPRSVETDLGHCFEEMSDTDSDDRDASFNVPVPDPDKYMDDFRNSSASPERRNSRDRNTGENMIKTQFDSATAALAQLWAMPRNMRVKRLEEINEHLPPELRVFLP